MAAEVELVLLVHWKVLFVEKSTQSPEKMMVKKFCHYGSVIMLRPTARNIFNTFACNLCSSSCHNWPRGAGSWRRRWNRAKPRTEWWCTSCSCKRGSPALQSLYLQSRKQQKPWFIQWLKWDIPIRHKCKVRKMTESGSCLNPEESPRYQQS